MHRDRDVGGFRILGFVRRYRVVVPGHIIWSSGCSTISALVMGVLVGRFADLLGICFYMYLLGIPM